MNKDVIWGIRLAVRLLGLVTAVIGILYHDVWYLAKGAFILVGSILIFNSED